MKKKNRRQNGSNSDTAVHVSIHECVCMQGAIHYKNEIITF